MRKTISLIVLGAVCTLALLTVLGMTVYKEKPVEPTQEAYDTTFRNSFVSACTAEGVSGLVCSCAYNKLDQLYPDWTTDETRLNRIIQYGYNPTETDVMVSCLDMTQTN